MRIRGQRRNVEAIGAQTGDISRDCRDNKWEYAIVSPQSEVMEWEARWPNVEAFIADKRKVYDARTKKPAIGAADTEEPV